MLCYADLARRSRLRMQAITVPIRRFKGEAEGELSIGNASFAYKANASETKGLVTFDLHNDVALVAFLNLLETLAPPPSEQTIEHVGNGSAAPATAPARRKPGPKPKGKRGSGAAKERRKPGPRPGSKRAKPVPAPDAPSDTPPASDAQPAKRGRRSKSES